ncbi:retrovirus-related pol polyprotein from transposon TNT 1-94 [Tanacetum coccineum]
MDLCGPMRVASINEKRYILVIVDDYSRFTWVRFLKTKDEAPAAIIKCIKNIQVHLNATVQNVRTDNGTEFVNQTLREFYENAGISHQTSGIEFVNQTLYKKPDLSFLHVFGSLCYPTNDHEDLGKFDAKADIGIFVGYAPAKKAFRILNRRLDSNPVSQQPCLPPLRDDWDQLFQPMFDEYFNPPTIAVSPVQEAAAPRAEVLADSPVSTSIDQDAPSKSIPSSQEHEHSPIIYQSCEESLKTPTFHDDPLNESPQEDSTSQGSSSNVRQLHTPLEHLGRWTKDHPLANVIGDPSRSVSTRKQLETDAMWCYFDAFLTFVEPKNFKQAMTEPIMDRMAMLEELMNLKDLKFRNWCRVQINVEWRWLWKDSLFELEVVDVVMVCGRFGAYGDDGMLFCFLYLEIEMMCVEFGCVECDCHFEVEIELSGFGIGEVELSTFDVLQMFVFFLQMGFTLILATLDGLDVCLLGDVIGEDDGDEGTDIAKISRKRSKPDNHGHGNGKDNTRAGRMLSKVNKSQHTK